MPLKKYFSKKIIKKCFKFFPCDSKIPQPSKVLFGSHQNPCLKEPCPVYKSLKSGTTFIDFKADREITALRPQLQAKILGIIFNVVLPEDLMKNAWTYLYGKMPLKAGDRGVFNLTVPIEQSTPLINSMNIFTLFDQNDLEIFCYEIATVVKE